MDKLDFGFLCHEDILEASVPEGFYHIYYSGNGFKISVNLKDVSITAEFPNIYEALDAANAHYKLYKQ